MKSFVVLCVFLISFCSIVQDGICATFRVRNATHPDYPGRCYYNDTEPIILRKGQKKRYSKQCLAAECLKDYTLLATGCGIFGGIIHCRVVKGDPSKPYPHCCDEYIC
ncbi:uncharacterized protein CBL_02723 [Carabus blaptoides fortunei]